MSNPFLRVLSFIAGLALGTALLSQPLSGTHPSSVFAASRSSRSAGQVLFHEKGCEHCHGPDGIGGEKGPSLSGVGRKLTPAQISKQIHEGGEDMPAFGDVLTPEEIGHLVDYLSAKRQKMPRNPAAPVAPPAPKPAGSDDQ